MTSMKLLIFPHHPKHGIQLLCLPSLLLVLFCDCPCGFAPERSELADLRYWDLTAAAAVASSMSNAIIAVITITTAIRHTNGRALVPANIVSNICQYSLTDYSKYSTQQPIEQLTVKIVETDLIQIVRSNRSSPVISP